MQWSIRTWKGKLAAIVDGAWIFDAVDTELERIGRRSRIERWTVRFLCPRCWSDFANDVVRRPKCGLDIPAFFQSKDYVDRLILALGHPARVVREESARTLENKGLLLQETPNS
ncbi:MAG: hypothetical protein ACLQPD_13250 [Desulfomonilaceae bacterium]